MNIKEIEAQIERLVSNDKKSWVQIYELMDTVENEQLYTSEEYHSFTAWVKALATRCHVHESLLWARKKAGKFYSEFSQRQKEQGNTVPDIHEIKVSPDNFVLVDKIAGNNPKVADDLMKKVVSGELKRKDLKAAWENVRTERKPLVNSEHKEVDNTLTRKSETTITASDLILALSANDYWIPNPIEKKYCNKKYKLLAEFPIQGVSEHARRIDAMIIENVSASDRDEVVLQGIEIKVDKNDLLNDKKMSEYCDYCDYFWLAIPESLLEYAQEIRLNTWGIITINDKHELKVVVPASKNKPIMRDKALMTALLKTI